MAPRWFSAMFFGYHVFRHIRAVDVEAKGRLLPRLTTRCDLQHDPIIRPTVKSREKVRKCVLRILQPIGKRNCNAHCVFSCIGSLPLLFRDVGRKPEPVGRRNVACFLSLASVLSREEPRPHLSACIILVLTLNDIRGPQPFLTRPSNVQLPPIQA